MAGGDQQAGGATCSLTSNDFREWICLSVIKDKNLWDCFIIQRFSKDIDLPHSSKGPFLSCFARTLKEDN